MRIRESTAWAIAVWALAQGSPATAAAGQVWETRDGFRAARLEVPAKGSPGFTLLRPEQTGIFFTNQLAMGRGMSNQNLFNGAGVAAGDFGGDGWPDLYFCSLEGGNGLFRNLGGFKFENVATVAGVVCSNWCSRGAAFADVDGDGRLDLLVSSAEGRNGCFLNDGRNGFRDATQEAGLSLLNAGCETLALADIDGDGALDLYVANYGDRLMTREGGSLSVRMIGGKPQVVGRMGQRIKIIDGQFVEYGHPHALFRNDGHGRFTPLSWTNGTFLTEAGLRLREAPRDFGLSAMFRDINGDGAPDLYVCNDFQTPDRIWINDGLGHFWALSDVAIRTTPQLSMCVDFADLNGDGLDEILAFDMRSHFHSLRLTQRGATNPPASQVGMGMDRQQARRNTVQLNRGDNTYAEIANYAGLEASDWTWSAAAVDVDLDGYEDLLVANGFPYHAEDMDLIDRLDKGQRSSANLRGGQLVRDLAPLLTPNYVFRNRGDLTFEEKGAAWGFNSSNVCHGIALADLDNDGDMDVAVSCLGQPPLIYRNNSAAPRVAVRLKGKAPNTQGIGARITVRGGPVPAQTQEIQAGGRYLSSDQPMRCFAAGSVTNRLSIEVRWRSGLVSLASNLEANCLYEFEEARASSLPRAAQERPTPMFQDASGLLGHRHAESSYSDLDRQPLLARMHSSQGPGVAWVDLDGDGREVLVVGTGRGGALGLFKPDGKGAFEQWKAPAWNQPAPDDLAGLAGWTPKPGERALLAGVTRYEAEPVSAPAVLRLDTSPKAAEPKAAFTPALEAISPGPLAVADVDGDGQLDVFVGSRLLPGQYPQPGASKIFRNRGGSLEADEENSRVLENAGLVSGAVFSDLDGDGWPDLALACEWGPVRVFRNQQGRLREMTREWGFAELTGWWNGVSVGDFDGDGRLDILASNWGLNSSYQKPTTAEPLRLYYGDFDENGTVDLVEAHTDSGRIVPRRDLAFLRAGWPLVRTRFSSHAQYAAADIKAVLGEQASKARELQAATLASMLFLNRGGRFEAAPLPAEAQWAPAFAVCVGDMDGDGNEDAFLSQNFFAMRLEEPRLDAGRGLWLRGDGRGRLTPVPGQVSGVMVYGEQRGAALCDYDGDGRVDLAVAQNNAETKLYRNAGARPGLRVRLAGPAGNPTGVGAVVRLGDGEGRFGAARAIHAGSGYYSQDSAVQVMNAAFEAKQIQVRWPGGKVTTSALPPRAREAVVSPDGGVRER